MSNIDFRVRKAVAIWCQGVSLETTGATLAARKAVAKRMLENISPATPDKDSALAHVVFLVRAFAPVPENEMPDQAITDLLLIIMDAFVAVGAFS